MAEEVKRSRIAPISKKRRGLAGAKREIREAVFDRDDHRCQLAGVDDAGPCYGHLTPHHKLKASQGGAYDEDNLVTACAGHNDRIEEDASFSAACEKVGLVIRRTR